MAWKRSPVRSRPGPPNTAPVFLLRGVDVASLRNRWVRIRQGRFSLEALSLRSCSASWDARKLPSWVWSRTSTALRHRRMGEQMHKGESCERACLRF